MGSRSNPPTPPDDDPLSEPHAGTSSMDLTAEGLDELLGLDDLRELHDLGLGEDDEDVDEQVAPRIAKRRPPRPKARIQRRPVPKAEVIPLRVAPREESEDDPRQLGPVLHDLAASDPVVQAYRPEAHVGVVGRLRAVQIAIAEAAADLSWLREHPELHDDLLESGRAVSRRVRALKKLAEADLHELHTIWPGDESDPRSPEAYRAVRMLHERIMSVARDVLSPDRAEALETGLDARLRAEPAIPWP